MRSFDSRSRDYVILIFTFLIGTISLLFWLVFLFHGSLNLINLGLGEVTRLGFDGCLCFTFFIQHSTMIRKSFRHRLENYIEADYHGPLFTISSGVILLVCILFWQESNYTLAEPQGILRWLLHSCFFISFVGFNWGTRALGSFDMFSVGQILNRLRDTDPQPSMPFAIRGPYRWVRHPLYSFCLIMIWSCPNLTLDRLLYNILWTAWIIVGSVLEERDLVTAFGEVYRDYQRNVPMLIPKHVRPVDSF